MDDLVIAPAATKKVRHAAGEWTPGAANWPSGGLDFDAVVYNHYDHAGNLRAQSGKNGLTTGAAWVSDAFGDHATGGPDYQHTANHLDADTGLFYFNNRWFDVELGRFTQRNTPFQPLAEHAYVISEGNPVSLIDPSGYDNLELRERNLPIGHGSLDGYLPFSHLSICYTSDEGEMSTLAAWRDEEGKLHEIPNDHFDRDDPYIEVVTTIIPPDGMDNKEYFDEMKRLQDEYSNNRVPYSLVPLPCITDGFNSNSYAGSLVTHSGGSYAQPWRVYTPQYVGIMRTIPAHHFGSPNSPQSYVVY